jgi:hypothetical protein
LPKKESLNSYLDQPQICGPTRWHANFYSSGGSEFDLFRGEVMKKFFGVLGMGCFLTLLVVGSAQAQDPGTALRASIPFDFNVGGRTLPAGKYEIRRVNDEPVGLVIQNVDHRHKEAMFPTEPVDAHKIPSQNLLIFHRYGDSYFLSEVLTAGEGRGEELLPTHAERQLRSEMAKNQLQPETVTVAMN